MAVLRRDYLPAELQEIFTDNGVDGCVAVQADQSEKETKFLLALAEDHAWIKGVVGWTDLCANNVETRLEYYRQFGKLKGFRHILQGERERDMMLQPAFLRGIKKLALFNYTYDILIFPDQLKYTATFASMLPTHRLVIDHLAKPPVREGMMEPWKKEIEAVAGHPNVYCKISGMVTEAVKSWKKEDIIPYIDVVVEAFGIDRIMYGSDWPVCLGAASYENVLGIVREYFSKFSKDEQQKFFGSNAAHFYNLT